MIESDRLISAKTADYEDVQDRAIRPALLADYVGQPAVREQMDILFCGPQPSGSAGSRFDIWSARAG